MNLLRHVQFLRNGSPAESLAAAKTEMGGILASLKDGEIVLGRYNVTTVVGETSTTTVHTVIGVAHVTSTSRTYDYFYCHDEQENAIETAINNLDKAGYAQGKLDANGKSFTISGIKEENGLISIDESNNLTLSIDGDHAYTTNNPLATVGTVSAAIDALDTTSDVRIARIGDYTAGNAVATRQITFNGIKEVNGIIQESGVTDTLYMTGAVTADNPLVVKSDLSGIVGAMVYQGTIDSTHALPSNPKKGHVYMVSENGTYDDKACEVGDMFVFNGTSWDVINGENQVSNADTTITAGAANASTLATVDGTTITAKVSVKAGTATIATVTDDVVTLQAGIEQVENAGTIQGDGTEITLAKVAKTGTAADVALTKPTDGWQTLTNTDDEAGTTATSDVQTAVKELDAAIAGLNADVVKSIKATGDDWITVAPTTATNGDVIMTFAHKTNSANATEVTATDTIAFTTGNLSNILVVPSMAIDAAGHVTTKTDTTYTITLPESIDTAVQTVVGDDTTSDQRDFDGSAWNYNYVNAKATTSGTQVKIQTGVITNDAVYTESRPATGTPGEDGYTPASSANLVVNGASGGLLTTNSVKAIKDYVDDKSKASTTKVKGTEAHIVVTPTPSQADGSTTYTVDLAQVNATQTTTSDNYSDGSVTHTRISDIIVDGYGRVTAYTKQTITEDWDCGTF